MPQFLLRQFGSDKSRTVSDRKQISMLMIEQNKCVRDVSIKGQCASNYLYGKDLVIENALGPIEGAFSALVKRFVGTNSITDDIASRMEVVLLIALQKSRTLAAKEDSDSMAEKMLRLMSYGKMDRTTLESVKISFADSAAVNVQNAVIMSPIMYDLKQVLIVNTTSRPFVISDNPVCITNWFLSARRSYLGIGGTGSAGIQILMPISEHHALLLFDNNIYSIGTSSKLIYISNLLEVDHLNRLQYLNSFKAIYFNNDFLDTDIKMLLSVLKPPRTQIFERAEKLSDSETYLVNGKNEFDSPEPETTSEIVRFGSFQLSESLRLRQIKLRAKPKYFDDGSASGPTCDPAWSQIVQDFNHAASNRGLVLTDIGRFANTHRLGGRVGKWFKQHMQ